MGEQCQDAQEYLVLLPTDQGLTLSRSKSWRSSLGPVEGGASCSSLGLSC